MLITAWWDVHRQFAPGHHPRRRRVRPLRALEQVLGHRVQSAGYSRYDAMLPDQYQYTAYSWLDADTIDDAVMFSLSQLARLDCPIQHGLYRLNRQAVVCDEELKHTIGAFYWNTHKQPPLVDVDSGGVLLLMTSSSAIRHHARHLLAHTIRVPRLTSPRANFAIVAEIVMMGDAHDVRELHWPRYRDANNMHGFDIVSFKGRSGPGTANYLTVERSVTDASETTAVCAALACIRGVNLQLDLGTDAPLVVTTQQSREGLVSLRVLRKR
jgi:hypothetical protein